MPIKHCRYCKRIIKRPWGRQITCNSIACQKKMHRSVRSRSRARERRLWKEMPGRIPPNQPRYDPPIYEIVTSFRSRELLTEDGDRRVARWAIEDGSRMPNLGNSDEGVTL